MSEERNRIKSIASQLAKRAAEKEKPKEPVVYASMALEKREDPDSEEALRAIARSVVAQDNLDVIGARVQIVDRPDTLKANCIFIKQAYIFLGLLECPGDARDLILWFAGQSEGNFTRMFTWTQEQIAKDMGLSIDTVQRKLKALEQWEQKFNRTVIQIKKQPYDYKTKKYGTTEYRILASKYVLEYANRAKGLNYQERTSEQLLQDAIDQGHREIAEEVIDDAPLAPIIPRNQKRQEEKNVTPEQIRSDRGKRVFNQMMANAATWLEVCQQNGLTISESTERMQKGLQKVINRFSQEHPEAG